MGSEIRPLLPQFSVEVRRRESVAKLPTLLNHSMTKKTPYSAKRAPRGASGHL